MDYDRLPFNKIREIARDLGIHPLGGQGINKPYLIQKIKERLQAKEKEKKAIQKEYIKEKRTEKETRREEAKAFITKSPHKEDASSSEAFLRENNPELYDFLSPVVGKIPSLRKDPFAPFEEDPWSLILDEMNAMSEDEYQLLDIITNGNEKEIFSLLAKRHEEIYSMFETYPILLYGILLRRRPEDPWIHILVVLSGAQHLEPFHHFIEAPLYLPEEMHPFVRLQLSHEDKEAMSQAINYIERFGVDVDIDPYVVEVFFRIIATHMNNHPLRFRVFDYYKFFEYNKLPLTKNILHIFLIMYDLYERADSTEAFVFANVLARAIFIPEREEEDIDLVIRFMHTRLFNDMMKEIISKDKDDAMIVVFPYQYPYGNKPANEHLYDVIARILLMKNTKPSSILGEILKEQYTYSYRIAGDLGQRVNLYLSLGLDMDAYGSSLAILSNKIHLPFDTLLRSGLKEERGTKLPKKKIYDFLSGMLKNIALNQKGELHDAIIEYGSHVLSKRYIARLT